MSLFSIAIDMKSCRICLSTKNALCPLFKYKLSGNYAEMLTAIADVKLSSSDGLPDKICVKCCHALEKAYLIKTLAEKSDRRLRKYVSKMKAMAPTKKLAFNDITDIKSEIGSFSIKPEPKWEVEFMGEGSNAQNPLDSMKGKDIMIANTSIRKVEGGTDTKNDFFSESADVSWKSIKTDIKDDDGDVEYLDDNFFEDADDDNDKDYEPLSEIKAKFKKPKVPDLKAGRKVMKKIKVAKIVKPVKPVRPVTTNAGQHGKTTLITCYPVNKNGSRGPAILLKRPKDATVLKLHPNYTSKKSSEGRSIPVMNKPIRVVRSAKPIAQKQKEKLVCPVCGILTFTLGNHMTTHQEKKRYSCEQCNKTFAQKGNMAIHMKQHKGIKDCICEICGAGFYCQKGLLRHNLIHKGERPFGCTLCTKRFIARCDLNRHLRIHSGYKPYKCAACTMSFNAKHQLQNHERMHTGERPYTCQVCHVAFSYKVNLNNHVMKVHGVNLKFKSIHTVTEDVLRQELESSGETHAAITHIMPGLEPGAHETVSDY